ncbi:M20 family metallopeptidase [Deinococcus peraridilitoris]|uniref:Acetylornithine deacetylase/succinyldiaminopimelate desuccinylase-like deacylase n=1 Tax=Deinococcus peraridilitoris (strain DSM 19664 / LMG 22246 / CIP 109416 / KR-200) TaxID=937777 RepID=L0A3B9_DEIPD|nr:M20 family metallopeptidase [Deinococcus peraridilitoris]AFZ68393.1 acetylornithine deacetylase/succinyldiaminopimelate desuccinylase-like deacylase [Deinococcus peraridilitoris DSM 19664]
MPIPVSTQALLEDLSALVHTESPSDDRESVKRVMETVEGWMRDLGATVLRLDGDTRRFILDGRSDSPEIDDRSVVILAHADTVWPHGTLNTMPFRVEGERVYGPGTYDMKGGIVGAIHALRALAGTLPHRVELLLTPDEEVGSYDSRAQIETAARRARAILVVEPPVAGTNALKTGRKGTGMYHVKLHGVASHAGNAPERGASAIAEAARTLLAVEGFADSAKGTTLSVGRIAGGGAINVVPAFAEFWVDTRIAELGEAERIETAMRGLRAHDERTRLEVEGGLNRPPFERTEGTAALYTRAQQAARELGFEVGEAFVGGGSDGNFTAPLCPTLDGLGAPGDGAHAEYEHIDLSAWPRHVQLLAELIRDPGV